MELKITDEGLRSAISEAILSQISGDARDAMIREALKTIVERRANPNSYGKDRGSVIQEAFADSCARLTHEIVQKLLREDAEVIAMLTDFTRESITKMFTDPEGRIKLISAFTDAFRKAITGERY